MKAPDIEFSGRSSALRMLGIALLTAGALAVGASAWRYFSGSHELENIEAQIRASSAQAARRQAESAKRTEPQISAQKIVAINEAIARLNIPWSELFAAIESADPKDVALLALLPEARKRTLVVQAETPTPRAMLAFVDRLRAVPLFEEAVLVKHERRDRDAGQPYRFAVAVRWRQGG